MPGKSSFSIVSFYEIYLRRCFKSSGLLSQTITIENNNNNQTTIHLWAPMQPIPQKPSLLLLHGFGPSPIWQWRKQVQFFAPMFNLYVPDLVFFGMSKTTSHERSEIFQAECMGMLMEKLGVKNYNVMGTSYGGFVAFRMASGKWQENIQKVVIASSGVNMRKDDNNVLLEKAKMEKIEDLMLPQRASDMRKSLEVVSNKKIPLPNFLLNDIIRTLYSDSRDEKVQLLEGLTLGRDEEVNISPLQQDVLIVWGDQDCIFPVNMAYELQRLLGSNTRLDLIKNSSHIPQLDNPNEFNNIVKNFLCGSS